MEGSGNELQVRHPVIENASPTASIERQWRFTTESVKRDILSDPEKRQAILPFLTTPVSETLPQQFFDAIPTQSTQLGMLKDFLATPAVPDASIKPDLRNAERLSTPADERAMMETLGFDPQMVDDWIQEKNQEGLFLQGLSTAEYDLVTRRYRYARDIKLLALQAEMLDQHDQLTPEEDGEFTGYRLPSGIEILMTSDGQEAKDDLLSPQLWEKRRQIKDRVYEIEIQGKKYILKEKKTARHTDTKEGGHQNGLTSEQELQTAHLFHTTQEKKEEGVALRWEEPLAAVTYPDGYQFTIFTHVPDLISLNEVRTMTKAAIARHREVFQPEFNQLASSAQDYLYSPAIDTWATGNVPHENDAIAPQLTFMDFIAVKAKLLLDKTQALRKQTMLESGYQVADFDGYAFRINETEESFVLEEVGFDFEYFHPISLAEQERWRNARAASQKLNSRIPADRELNSRIRQAAYLAATTSH